MTTNKTEAQSTEWKRSVLLSLEVGDKILANDRNRPWELVERTWDDRESGYWRFEFKGYGTHYSGIVPPPEKSDPSYFTTTGGKQIFLKSVERVDEKDATIVSDIRAEEWLDECGIDIR